MHVRPLVFAHVKTDLYFKKEPYTRDLLTLHQTPGTRPQAHWCLYLLIWKETYTYEKNPRKEPIFFLYSLPHIRYTTASPSVFATTPTEISWARLLMTAPSNSGGLKTTYKETHILGTPKEPHIPQPRNTWRQCSHTQAAWVGFTNFKGIHILGAPKQKNVGPCEIWISFTTKFTTGTHILGLQKEPHILHLRTLAGVATIC